ncbi:glycosyltransferase involved in cell wall biosynthesis [Idiomarina loihiensis]|jgi:glycosyltransferase involved in cell wall biosynthesis|uniref:glycosyltransferase n=1 Tax=Idiomarina TaxID=135575 RepID=UPI000D718C02|nr:MULTISPECIES: glycosyltransferase [Idiomarina]PWW37690.1 glycosyltransferase involved in cell wall biosynthesis [Idiomarina loihiensis]TDP47403.1 glycosyltransferase involved in cell wall biosynthesis [Idiomarina loihiensis]TDS23144.1 glycosyltransferase involved in cell wall biosynthesis [Idiomarina sp. H2]
MSKIALLSAASSIHTVRWANALSSAGHEIHVISQHQVEEPLNPEVILHQFPYFGTIGYYLMVPKVRKLLKEIRPDIVNAHYVSGYGTTARLVNYSPLLLSVWGSDVYLFPYKSLFHKWLVKKNLRAADKIASTSHCMAAQIRTLVPEIKKIAITPFGVDMAAYQNIRPVDSIQKSKIVIGTVKTMSSTYGIDTLIEAFSQLLVRLERGDTRKPQLELRLVGGGEQMHELFALAEQLGIAEKIVFVGRVPHSKVPEELEKLDIYVALSRFESFGVSILEAGAAKRPVVVSDAQGLLEVTKDGETGFVVPKADPKAAADVLEKIVSDPELRRQVGLAGQRHVMTNYSWDSCVKKMLNTYKETIQDK